MNQLKLLSDITGIDIGFETSITLAIFAKAYYDSPDLTFSRAKGEMIRLSGVLFEFRDNDKLMYHSLFHELAHATGHKSRLNRESLMHYMINPLAKPVEETIADTVANRLMKHYGYDTPELDEQHRQYKEQFKHHLPDEAINPDIALAYNMVRSWTDQVIVRSDELVQQLYKEFMKAG